MDQRLKKVENELTKYIDNSERIKFILQTGTPDELSKIVELGYIKDLITAFPDEYVKSHYIYQENNVHFVIDKNAKNHPNLKRLIKVVVKSNNEFENPVYISVDDHNPEALLIE